MLQKVLSWFRGPQPPPPNPSKALQDDLSEAIARLGRVEERVGEIALQWLSVLDKINRFASQQAARERKRAEAALDRLNAAGAEGTLPGNPETQGEQSPLPVAGDIRLASKAQLRQLAASQFGLSKRGLPHVNGG